MPEVRFTGDPSKRKGPPTFSTDEKVEPRQYLPPATRRVYILFDIVTNDEPGDHIIALASRAYMWDPGEGEELEPLRWGISDFYELVGLPYDPAKVARPHGEDPDEIAKKSSALALPSRRDGLTDAEVVEGARIRNSFGVVGKMWQAWVEELVYDHRLTLPVSAVLVTHGGFGCGKFAALATELARHFLQASFQTGAVDWWCLDTLDIIERERFYPGLGGSLPDIVDYILKTHAQYHVDGRSFARPHTFMSYCGGAFNARTMVCGLAVIMQDRCWDERTERHAIDWNLFLEHGEAAAEYWEGQGSRALAETSSEGDGLELEGDGSGGRSVLGKTRLAALSPRRLRPADVSMPWPNGCPRAGVIASLGAAASAGDGGGSNSGRIDGGGTIATAGMGAGGAEDSYREGDWWTEWRSRIDDWWLSLPLATQARLGECSAAFGLHLAARFELAMRLAERLMGGQSLGEAATPPPAASVTNCEWVGQRGLLELPDFPQLPHKFELVPLLPRLLPGGLQEPFSRLQSTRPSTEESGGGWTHSLGAAAAAGAASSGIVVMCVAAYLGARRKYYPRKHIQVASPFSSH